MSDSHAVRCLAAVATDLRPKPRHLLCRVTIHILCTLCQRLALGDIGQRVQADVGDGDGWDESGSECSVDARDESGESKFPYFSKLSKAASHLLRFFRTGLSPGNYLNQ